MAVPLIFTISVVTPAAELQLGYPPTIKLGSFVENFGDIVYQAYAKIDEIAAELSADIDALDVKIDSEIAGLASDVADMIEYVADATDGAVSTDTEVTIADDVAAVLFADENGNASGAVLADGTVALEKGRFGQLKADNLQTSHDDSTHEFAITDLAGNPIAVATPDGVIVANANFAADEANFEFGVTDEAGNPILRVRPEGVDVSNVSFTGDQDSHAVAVTDDDDNAVAGFSPDGFFIGDLSFVFSDGNLDFAVTDLEDNLIFGFEGGTLYLPGGASIDTLETIDAANRAYAALYLSRPVDGVQQPITDYVSIIGYGQSLQAGQECWPILSTTQQFGNLQLGGDIRPTTGDGASWTQVSPSGLQPLVPRVRATNDDVLDDVDVAALSPADQARGESPVVGMANMASWLISRRTLATPKPFIVTCPAVSGKTIEQLSKVNGQDATNRYGRFTGGLSQIQTIADGASKSHSVSAIAWMQGEYDYHGSNGSTNATKVLYKAALAQLHADMVEDCKTETGQTDDPIFILYQTSGNWARDADINGLAGLHVGMAQLEYALENPTKVIMAGPSYPVTDKGGHLDSNGSRWFGQMLAKAYVRSVIDGRRFRPLSPIKIEAVSATKVRLHMFVPVPPLQFAMPYVVNTATDFSAKGFRITDASGAAAIASVTIVGDTIIDIVTSRNIDIASAHLWYASKTTFDGAGCLRDSDDALARDQYVYLSGSGMYASADIDALVDQPYPLNNWCTAFYLPVGYEE